METRLGVAWNEVSVQSPCMLSYHCIQAVDLTRKRYTIPMFTMKEHKALWIEPLLSLTFLGLWCMHSLPGPITCSMQKKVRRPGESYHMIDPWHTISQVLRHKAQLQELRAINCISAATEKLEKQDKFFLWFGGIYNHWITKDPYPTLATPA